MLFSPSLGDDDIFFRLSLSPFNEDDDDDDDDDDDV